MRMGFGWGRMGILQAVTMAVAVAPLPCGGIANTSWVHKSLAALSSPEHQP